MRITIKDKRYLHSAARKLLRHYGGKKIFAFYGAMGAGKTTFIKTICDALGAIDTASSPTFTLVNEYRTKTGEPLYHIDLYRIRNLIEVFDIGIEEYLYSGSYCFIEWPELAGNLLPEETVRVSITVTEDEARILETI
ncbi:MAG: tRNA (adenosine(37)-N6)-threonylcarbamoyltransferase complex ATPase subunit type 1 TsaE [Bacteroidota bacterium]